MKKIKKNRSKTVRGDDDISQTGVLLSPRMKRFYENISDRAGRNANNQATLSHGIQACALLGLLKCGVDTKRLYPNINH